MVLENALQTTPETIFPEKSAELCFVFPEILFPKMVTRKFSEIALKIWHFWRIFGWLYALFFRKYCFRTGLQSIFQNHLSTPSPKNIFRKMFFGLGSPKNIFHPLFFRKYKFLKIIYKCNFCMGDLGINGFAALKQKKIHPAGLKQ